MIQRGDRKKQQVGIPELRPGAAALTIRKRLMSPPIWNFAIGPRSRRFLLLVTLPLFSDTVDSMAGY